MATRRAAGDREVRRVPAVLLDVLADPGDRPLHVDDVRRPGVARREPVVEGHADPPLRGQVVHERDALGVLGAEGPPAAVHLQQHRRSAHGPLRGRVDVQQAAPAVLGCVGDVPVHPHALGAPPEGVHQRAPRQGQVGRGRRGVQLLDVVHPQALDQRLLDALADPAGLVHQHGEADDAGRAERETDGVAAPPGRVRRHVGGGQREQVRGQLGGQPAGPEGQHAGAESRHRAQGVRGEGGDGDLAQTEEHGPHSRTRSRQALGRAASR